MAKFAEKVRTALFQRVVLCGTGEQFNQRQAGLVRVEVPRAVSPSVMDTPVPVNDVYPLWPGGVDLKRSVVHPIHNRWDGEVKLLFGQTRRGQPLLKCRVLGDANPFCFVRFAEPFIHRMGFGDVDDIKRCLGLE